MSENEFNPDWVSHPGGTLRDILQERKLTYRDAAKVIGISGPYINRVCSGKKPITLRLAFLLERAKMGAAKFWWARQSHYEFNRYRLRRRKAERP